MLISSDSCHKKKLLESLTIAVTKCEQNNNINLNDIKVPLTRYFGYISNLLHLTFLIWASSYDVTNNNASTQGQGWCPINELQKGAKLDSMRKSMDTYLLGPLTIIYHHSNTSSYN